MTTPVRRILLCALLIGALPSPARAADAPTGGADELVGLWVAKRWFGPFARGPLTIRRSGASYTATMVGLELPVRLAGRELSFDLPRGQGSFRGLLPADGTLLGHWYPPPSVAMGGRVTPVRLVASGKDRWSGEVVPFDDIFTFYLRTQKREDGTVSALLRNPERDFGALLGVERMAREGSVVKLMGRRRGEKEERLISSGTYDAENGVITLGFPDRGGSYDFRRDDDSSDFYPRGKFPARYAYRAPPAAEDGWSTGTLEEASIDRAGIERVVQMLIDAPMDSASTPKVHALLVARHGRLVLEEYFHGENRDHLHETRSASKSVTAVLVGPRCRPAFRCSSRRRCTSSWTAARRRRISTRASGR
jgi:hypothetical protein